MSREASSLASLHISSREVGSSDTWSLGERRDKESSVSHSSFAECAHIMEPLACRALVQELAIPQGTGQIRSLPTRTLQYSGERWPININKIYSVSLSVNWYGERLSVGGIKSQGWAFSGGGRGGANGQKRVPLLCVSVAFLGGLCKSQSSQKPPPSHHPARLCWGMCDTVPGSSRWKTSAK